MEDGYVPHRAEASERTALWAVRVLTAIVTLVLLVSFGGQLAFLPMTPVYLYLAVRAEPVGRWLWLVAPSLGAAVAGWATVYILAGEPMPSIWMVPLMCFALAQLLCHRWVGRRRRNSPAALVTASSAAS